MPKLWNSENFNFCLLSKFKTVVLLALFAFAFLSPLAAQATAENENEEILFLQNKNVPAEENQELQLIIHDEATNVSPGNDESKKKIVLEGLRQVPEMANEKGIIIPIRPDSEEAFEQLNRMTSSELEVFLIKKEKFLNRFAAALKKLRLKPKLINRALKEVNTKFYASSRLIAKSNSMGGTVMASVSGGIALPKKVVEALKKTRVGRFIPKSGGFYYVMGLGAGVSRTVKEGKSVLSLEIFMDVEKLKSTITGLVELSVAGTYGVVYELREGKFASQKNLTSYGGVAGVFREGHNQFGWAASTGLSIPPGIGAFLLYKDEATRFYLLRVSKEGISVPALSIVTDFIKNLVMRPFRSDKTISCAKLFAAAL